MTDNGDTKNSRTTGDGPRRAVLLDIDGTLVDSNYLHIEAWARAFDQLDLVVDSWRIHRAIGMDSAKLIESLLGSDAEEFASRVKDLHARYYKESMSRLRPFRQARELLQDLSARGLTVVLATSAPENELKALRNVLQAESYFDHVTSAEDVEQAKPDPDIIRVALAKAGTEPAQTIMVGDAVWDIEAAKRVGVRSIGLLSGGTSASELLDAGAAVVYADVAELRDKLHGSPLADL